MAVQAPERRGTVEDDIKHALALSLADKRLGDYFPSNDQTSSGWHYSENSGHFGGGFDEDKFAYHDRRKVAREWEISVVQWARERELQDRGWMNEEEKRASHTVFRLEDKDVAEMKRRQDEAWREEQDSAGGSRESHLSKTKQKSPPVNNAPTFPLRQTFEDSSTARTMAWVSGARYVGDGQTADFGVDPDETGQLRTLEQVEKMPARSTRASSRASSHAPTIPTKYGRKYAKYESPKRSPTTPTSRPSTRPSTRPSSYVVVSPPRAKYPQTPDTAISIPPSLPTKASLQNLDRQEVDSPAVRRVSFAKTGRTTESYQPSTEDHYYQQTATPVQSKSKRASWSTISEHPEAINVLSPHERSKAHIRSRPGSIKTPSISRRSHSREHDDRSIVDSDHTHTPSPVDSSEDKQDKKIPLHNRSPHRTYTMSLHQSDEHSSWHALKDRYSMQSEEQLINSQFPGFISSSKDLSADPSFASLHDSIQKRYQTANEPINEDRHERYEEDQEHDPSLTAFSPHSRTQLGAARSGVVDTFSPSTSRRYADAVDRHAREAYHDPMNPNNLANLNFTVPQVPRTTTSGLYSVLDRIVAIPPPPGSPSPPHDTPPPMPVPIPFPVPEPAMPPEVLNKSLPGTPYTMTHSATSLKSSKSVDTFEGQKVFDEEIYFESPHESLEFGHSDNASTIRANLPPQYESTVHTRRPSLSLNVREKMAAGSPIQSSAVSYPPEASFQHSAVSYPPDAAQSSDVSYPEGENTPLQHLRSWENEKGHRRNRSTSSAGSASTVRITRNEQRQSGDFESESTPPPLPSKDRNIRPLSFGSGEGPLAASTPKKGGVKFGSEQATNPKPAKFGALKPIKPHHEREAALAARIAEQNPRRDYSPESSEEEEEEDDHKRMLRQSAHTFGDPKSPRGMAFFQGQSQPIAQPQVQVEYVDDWAGSSEDLHAGRANQSRLSVPSSTVSLRPTPTRTSTLRASLRSPLPDISEKDTNSELSYGDTPRVMALQGFAGHHPGESMASRSFGTIREEEGPNNGRGDGHNGNNGGQEIELMNVEAKEVDAYFAPMPRSATGGAPWNQIAQEAAAVQTLNSHSHSHSHSQPSQRSGTGSHNQTHHRRSASNVEGGAARHKNTKDKKKNGSTGTSSSFGEELDGGYAMYHPPGSHHATSKVSLGAVGQSSSSEKINEQKAKPHKPQSSLPKWPPEFKENEESGMAGVGAFGRLRRTQSHGQSRGSS